MNKRAGDKKSETIEVRVTLGQKQALFDTARRERITVSELIRKLISNYLSEKSMKQGFSLNGFRKLKLGLAAIACVFVTGISVIPLANAESIKIDIKGTFMKPAGLDGQARARVFKTQINVEEGQITELKLGHSLSKNKESELFLRFSAEQEEHPIYDKDVILIRLNVIERQGNQERLLAEPSLKVVEGETAEFNTISDDKKGWAIMFTPNAK